MEGFNLLEALLDTGLYPYEIYYQPDLMRRTPKGVFLLNRLLQMSDSDRLIEVSERVIEAIGETKTSQGVIAVLELSTLNPARIQSKRSSAQRPALLILDDVAKVLLTSRCVDYYSPKVLRSAAGAHLYLPVEVEQSWEAIAIHVTDHCNKTMRVFLAEANSTHMYYQQDLTPPYALIIGNEAHGASQEAHSIATTSISIPLAHEVESLNAAIACGVILYEGVRQLRARS